mgnify:CR=1 FL=1
MVARALLGQILVRGERAGLIVETEAYLGPEDLASHARFGPTKRTAVMFGEGGVTYVYLCYGMYELFNIVTGRAGEAGAVLLRALAPERGLGEDPSVARGPGKLTRAMGLSRATDGAVDLTTAAELFVAAGRRVPSTQVAVGPRIGVDYAGDWAKRPLRFWIDGHPAVSGMRRGGSGSASGSASGSTSGSGSRTRRGRVA